jgi:glyoxylase-like metal-dependent hydrolase (beta-lactamase superfamily II)
MRCRSRQFRGLEKKALEVRESHSARLTAIAAKASQKQTRRGDLEYRGGFWQTAGERHADGYIALPTARLEKGGRKMPQLGAHTEVSDAMVTPMDEIAAGVEGLRIAFVNVFGVSSANGSWTLVDTGLPFSAGLIRSWSERRFGRPPSAIVLTHGHFDHVSGAAELAKHWNVPVYAHPLEFPYLTGEREYPAPNTGAGGLMSVLSPMYPRGPVDLRGWLRPLPTGPGAEGPGAEDLSPAEGWEIIPTPGHTPGHISLFRPTDMVLMVGDAFCTTKPESFFDAAITQAPELHGPPAYFTADPQQAARSIRMLANLHPRIIAPGHGRPLAGMQLEQMLPQFAADYSGERAPDFGAAIPSPGRAAA